MTISICIMGLVSTCVFHTLGLVFIVSKKKKKGDAQNYSAVDSPPVDPFESLVATYFQLDGYITSIGKWFWVWDNDKHQPGYQDIDVLAIKGSETLVVSVTSNLDDKVAFKRNGSLDSTKMNKLLRFFKRAKRYLTETPDYKWIVQDGRNVRMMVVCANWHEKNLAKVRSVLQSKKIELKTSSEIFEELKEKLVEAKERGLRTNDPIIRFLRLWLKRGPE